MKNVNLNAIAWEEVPASYGLDYGHVHSDDANPDGLIIIDYSINEDKASLALRLDNDEWASSATTKDWPALDVAFGRKHWTQYLDNYRTEARDYLGLNDDEDDE